MSTPELTGSKGAMTKVTKENTDLTQYRQLCQQEGGQEGRSRRVCPCPEPRGDGGTKLAMFAKHKPDKGL
jgi:hypothetical protein